MDPLIQAGVALITGAGSGMGQAMAIKFAGRGCRSLFLVDLDENRMQKTQTAIDNLQSSCRVVLHGANVADAAAVKGMVAACVASFGRVDFCMNNAGIARGGIKTADMNVEVFDANCLVNERGNYLCQKYEIQQFLLQEPLQVFDLPAFKDRAVRGSIVNTGSLSGLITLSDFSAYASSKHAVSGLTRQLAREYAPHKIRVNSVCPGIVNTNIITASGLTKDFMDGLSKQAPMNRWIHAEEVAEVTVFLCSSQASAITGVNLPVDCGATLYHSQ